MQDVEKATEMLEKAVEVDPTSVVRAREYFSVHVGQLMSYPRISCKSYTDPDNE